jgi:hypothetical protein
VLHRKCVWLLIKGLICLLYWSLTEFYTWLQSFSLVRCFAVEYNFAVLSSISITYMLNFCYSIFVLIALLCSCFISHAQRFEVYVWHVSIPYWQHIIIIIICYLNVCCKKSCLDCVGSFHPKHVINLLCGNVGWVFWKVMVVHSWQYTLTHNSFRLTLTYVSVSSQMWHLFTTEVCLLSSLL